jgi:hypothetical protein
VVSLGKNLGTAVRLRSGGTEHACKTCAFAQLYRVTN